MNMLTGYVCIGSIQGRLTRGQAVKKILICWTKKFSDETARQT